MANILRFFACATFLFVQGVANAALVVSFSLPQTPAPSGSLVNGVDGFDFTPTVNLTVTALGFYDHNGDGFLHDHPVGIFNTATQTLVAPSATVTSLGILDTSSSFRFVNVAPFILSAGTTYTLSGYGEGPVFDPYINNPNGGLVFGPNVSFVRARSGVSSGLQFPTSASQVGITQSVFSGPNFQYTTAVPEPSSIALFLVGTMLLIKRRKRSANDADIEGLPA